MAFVPGQDEEEEQGLAVQGQEPLNLGAQAGLMGGGAGTDRSPTGNGAVDGKPTKSGFTNLQKYLAVNSEKANNMAGQVLGEGQKAEDDLKKETTSFGSMNVGSSGISQADQDDLTYARNNVNTMPTYDYVSDRAKDILEGGSTRQYSGLNESDVDSAASKVMGARDVVKDKTRLFADDPNGVSQRANYIKSKYNADGRYSAGEGSFDSFLSSSSELGTDKDKGFTARGKSLEGAAKDADTRLGTDSAKYKSTIAGNKKAVEDYNRIFTGLSGYLAEKKTIQEQKDFLEEQERLEQERLEREALEEYEKTDAENQVAGSTYTR
jgi:hypothetical protein